MALRHQRLHLLDVAKRGSNVPVVVYVVAGIGLARHQLDHVETQRSNARQICREVGDFGVGLIAVIGVKDRKANLGFPDAGRTNPGRRVEGRSVPAQAQPSLEGLGKGGKTGNPQVEIKEVEAGAPHPAEVARIVGDQLERQCSSSFALDANIADFKFLSDPQAYVSFCAAQVNDSTRTTQPAYRRDACPACDPTQRKVATQAIARSIELPIARGQSDRGVEGQVANQQCRTGFATQGEADRDCRPVAAEEVLELGFHRANLYVQAASVTFLARGPTAAAGKLNTLQGLGSFVVNATGC